MMVDDNFAMAPAESSLSLPQDWQGFPPAAGKLAALSGAIGGFFIGLLLCALPAWIYFVTLMDVSLVTCLGVATLAIMVVIALGARLGYLRWKVAAWKLDETGLHIKRGRFWRQQILIPRSRVQHLDLERGPLERHFGLATLTVHTAGTRLHALRQTGLLDADAVALRDALVPASDRKDDVL